MGEEGFVLFEEKNYVAPVIADVAFIRLNASAKQALALLKFSLSNLPPPRPHLLLPKKLQLRIILLSFQHKGIVDCGSYTETISCDYITLGDCLLAQLGLNNSFNI